MTEARARSTDPQTSHDAAKSVESGWITVAQGAILNRLRNDGPLTDERIIARLRDQRVSISPSGARSRRAELVKLGLVEDSGKREKTASGRQTIVWRAK